MAQEGIATLPMQGMAPQESQGIGAFEPQAEAPQEGMVPVSEYDRFEAIITALEKQMPGLGDKIQQILNEANLTPEQVEGLASVVEFIEQNKANYPAAIQSLVSQGAIEEGDFPPQYNEEFMIIMKMVIYGYQMRDRMAQPEPVPFAKGGLAQAAESLRQQGRGGDTILAHINPQEAALLKRMGGSGTINPATGLPEYFKNPFKAAASAVTGAVKAVGGAVKSVVGAANKILGPELTMIALTVGGFMIGGPALAPYMGSFAGLAGAAGAALGSAVGTYGSGGSFKDVLLNSATAFVGGAYGPYAGAAAGGASTLARGGTFKDALKTAAISAGTSALIQGLTPSTNPDGSAPMGTDLSRTGGIDANGNFVPSDGVVTPGSVSAVNPSGGSGTSVLTTPNVSANAPTGDVQSPFGLRGSNAPPPPPSYSGANQGLSSLDYQMPRIDLSAAPSAVPSAAGISTLPASSSLGNAITAAKPEMTLGQIGSNIAQGNFGQALSDTGTWVGQNKLLTAGLALGATGALGGFEPEQPPPPNLLERTPEGRVATGETYIANDPNKYIVQNLPGVNYTTQGGINYANIPTTSINGQPGKTVAPTMAYGSNQPRVVNNPYVFGQAYNFLPGNNQPRALAMGGPVYPQGTGIMALNRGGSAQYPRRTGQIQGPGTETSDDIPAMLSDGEFVVTAKAVRGVGNGSRREGAKKLYRMMHAMEKKAGGKV